jgi:hypothetical protein
MIGKMAKGFGIPGLDVVFYLDIYENFTVWFLRWDGIA